MTDLGTVLLSATVGALSAIVLNYLGRCLDMSARRRLVAAQVYAYLNYWYLFMVKKDEFRQMFALSEVFFKMKLKAMQKDVKTLFDHFEKLETTFKELADEEDKRGVYLDKLGEQLQKLTGFERETALEELEAFRLGLRRNERFISDEQAALLSTSAAGWVVHVREGADSLASGLKILFLNAGAAPDQKLDEPRLARHVLELVRDSLEFFENFKVLRTYAKQELDRNTVSSLIHYMIDR
jgi:hypothetical protein